MRKNTSGQKIGCQMVSATDGSAFTGSVTVSVTGDAGTQATGSVSSGACTHEGNGYHTYAPAQAETNYDLVAFTFTGTGAVPVTVQVYTLPTTGILAPATLGRTLVVDASGLADANAVKLGPSGSGAAQTARDIGASVLLSSGTGTGQIALTSGKVSPAANSIDSTAIANGAITNAKFGTTPGTAGGLMISGSNSATTFASLDVTGAFTVSDGIIVSASTSNRPAISATGNGSAAGMLVKSGASSTDAALICQAQGTNDNAIRLIATGTRHGIYATGGNTGHGVYFAGGATSGDGARFEAAASGHGLNAIGIGSGKFDIYAGSLGATMAITGNITGNLSGSVGSVTTKTGYKLASDGLDAILIEAAISASAALINDSGTQLTSINARQAVSLILAACAAKISGAATTTMDVKPAGLPAASSRVVATVDADGNRTPDTVRVPD